MTQLYKTFVDILKLLYATHFAYLVRKRERQSETLLHTVTLTYSVLTFSILPVLLMNNPNISSHIH